jgi:hypothetical protein
MDLLVATSRALVYCSNTSRPDAMLEVATHRLPGGSNAGKHEPAQQIERGKIAEVVKA